ncbi:hypothetical protein Taro_043766 [Colocasia esculenta]|uniref:ACB domain-containing protein n=1 Tax=Colocasia esculenta TaxID=4460 RepID=A0A843WK81_COLES|nr:hypothetical protein [Colocasia esculenta]
MGDWQELWQAVVIGLLFAFLVAKLISTVVSFREDNLKVVREEDLPREAAAPEVEPGSSSLLGAVGDGGAAARPSEAGASKDGKALTGTGGGDGAVKSSERPVGGYEDDDDDEDDDEWEGIESTELDELFSAATAFVAATAADRSSPSVSSDVQLQLYGLYKIATEGPCTAPQPSALKMTARAKWNAWQKLGAMPPEEAMQGYIMIVSELYPSWATGSSSTSRILEEGNDAPTSISASKGPVGPVFSSFVHEEESDRDIKIDAIHASAREGEANALLALIDNGVSVNLRDGEGRTPLHWAVDRGHLDVVEMLIRREADVNAKDGEGQTPLHYAVLCERDAIAELLVKHGADRDAKDNEGHTPHDL